MFECRYCKKSFVKERTLLAHSCPNKLRHQQRDETGVRIGFQIFLRFYELTQGSSKTKTYEDFCDSKFYAAFVKFGRHCVAIRCPNPKSFGDFLLEKYMKKIDYWCKDEYYLEWLHAYIRKESVEDAITRAIEEMVAYEESGNISNYADYFRTGNTNRIIYHIVNGRITPWILFKSQSGIEWLSKLTSQQEQMIIEWIDPDFWTKKFKDYPADAAWAEESLMKAGL